jgi:hypothetical protein
LLLGPGADDALGLQTVDLGVVQPEYTAKDLAIVLAERGGGAPIDRLRFRGEADRVAAVHDFTDHGVLDGLIEAAGPELRQMLLLLRLDGDPDRDPRVPQSCHDVVGLALAASAGDVLVQ